jgi:hypothetical protein
MLWMATDMADGSVPNGSASKVAGAPPHRMEDFLLDASLKELSWYQYFAQAQDVPHLSRMIHAFLAKLGFSDYSYHRSEFRSASETCLITTPRRLSDFYDGEGLWEVDPVVQHCAIDTAPIYRSVVNRFVEDAPFEMAAHRRLLKLRDYNASLGYPDCYHVAVRTSNGNGNGVLSVMTRNAAVPELHGRVARYAAHIQKLAKVIDYVGALKFPQNFIGADEPQEIVVSPKPLMLLQMLAKSDLSLADAADRLCISISTANKHVAVLKQAFDASTLWGVIYKATRAGLVK